MDSLPDLSLGSFPPGIPQYPRVASGSSSAPSSAPLATPSPPGSLYPNVTTRRRVGRFALSSMGDLSTEDQGDSYGDLLDTKDDITTTSMMTPKLPLSAKRPKGASAVKGSSALTLRDQEKHIDTLKKENFNLKLKVHFFEERLAQLAPEQMDLALKQNIQLKVSLQERTTELKKQKKLCAEMEKEMQRLQRSGANVASSSKREMQLEKEIAELRRQLGESVDQEHLNDNMRALSDRNIELEDEVIELRGQLEDNAAEFARLQDSDEQRADTDEVYKLRATLAERDDEKEDLADEVEGLRLALEEAEDRLRNFEDAQQERSASRAAVLEERREREAVEDELNALRDRLAASAIELQQKEDDLDVKNQEIDDLVGEHERIVRDVEEEWRGEVEEAREQVEELRDIIAERDGECKELRLQIPELEAQLTDIHDKFEQALAHQDEEAAMKDEELENANGEIARLSEQVYQLEEECDILKEDADRMREEVDVERERHDEVEAMLKEKIVHLTEDEENNRTRQEQLEQYAGELKNDLDEQRQTLILAKQEYEENIQRERRSLESKEASLRTALTDQARTQALLQQREQDLRALSEAERDAKRLGESHTSEKFSLQLEVDRLKRDVARLETEVERAKKECDDYMSKAKDRENSLDRLHSENRDLTTQLAVQTQARLNFSEKLDNLQESKKALETEAANYKSRATELEGRYSKEQRSWLSSETQQRDQLTERNTLLLTIYQYMDKILGVDKTPKKGSQAETKPFTNFTVFHDNIITRLKALSQIQLDFDKRCKETESRFADKLNEMRKQLDTRWKQIDKFESSVKAYSDAKTIWRKKFAAKEGELDALKVTNTELNSAINSLKRSSLPGDSPETRSLLTRASNAERRLIVAQNQLATAEEKLATVNQRTVSADSKWEARVKEYEARIKAAEERVKRERQGTKELTAERENNYQAVKKQLEASEKHVQHLNGLIEGSKPSTK